jgi:hypothetical protein
LPSVPAAAASPSPTSSPCRGATPSASRCESCGCVCERARGGPVGLFGAVEGVAGDALSVTQEHAE